MQTNDQATLLNEPPEVNAPEAVVVLDPPDAFDQAWAEQSKRELGAGFANRCLSVAIGLVVPLVLSVSLNIGLGWKLFSNPPGKYFTTENGRVTEVHPLDAPAYSQSDVAAFGADTIRESFTLDFVHYRDQMTRLGERYSEVGFQDYYKALMTSNVLAAVRDQRMNLSVEVGPGVIRSKGAPGGVHTWEFQYPVTLKLDGQQTSSPAQRFIFTQRIQRADERVKNAGLEVTQVFTSNAN
jgi:intracellular multiplication protein IcmL